LIDNQYRQLLSVRSHTTKEVVSNAVLTARTANIFDVPPLFSMGVDSVRDRGTNNALYMPTSASATNIEVISRCSILIIIESQTDYSLTPGRTPFTYFALLFNRALSLDGGNPNWREYSRLNWFGLS